MAGERIPVWLASSPGWVSPWLTTVSAARTARQGNSLKDLPYVAPFFQEARLSPFLMCLVVSGGQNYEAFLSGDWVGVLSSTLVCP